MKCQKEFFPINACRDKKTHTVAKSIETFGPFKVYHETISPILKDWVFIAPVINAMAKIGSTER
jgi:hypothetical protein